MVRALIPCLYLFFASVAGADPTFLWHDVHDGGGLYDDRVDEVVVAPDRHLIAAGVGHDDALGSDMIIRKQRYDDGSEVWMRRIPAFDTSDMAVGGIACDAAGDVIVGGHVLGCVG